MKNDPLDLDEQRRQAEDEARRKKIEHDNEIADIKALLELPEGRRFIWRQLSLAGVYRTSFSSDALQMARSEGRRELGLIVLADVTEADPEAYIKMIKEQKRG